MDDRFLHELREEPSRAFDERLRVNLRQIEEEMELERDAGWLGAWRRRLWIGAAVAAAVALVALVPPLRVSAQAFLDLFRVRQFVAVEVDPARMEELQKREITPLHVLGEPTVLREPSDPVAVADEASAAGQTGMFVEAPAHLPCALVRDSILVRGDGEVRVTVDAERVNRTLSELGIADTRLPAALDGAEVSLRIPASVEMHYGSGGGQAHFYQSPSPEVGLPSGVDRAELATIALRVVGLSTSEARRIAESVDLDGTVLLPLPADATRFRQVDVNGVSGLLIETSSPAKNRRGFRREGAVILWANAGKVYALGGTLDDLDLLEMARSVR